MVRNFGDFEFLSWGDFVWKNNDFNNWVSFRAEKTIIRIRILEEHLIYSNLN